MQLMEHSSKLTLRSFTYINATTFLLIPHEHLLIIDSLTRVVISEGRFLGFFRFLDYINNDKFVRFSGHGTWVPKFPSLFGFSGFFVVFAGFYGFFRPKNWNADLLMYELNDSNPYLYPLLLNQYCNMKYADNKCTLCYNPLAYGPT